MFLQTDREVNSILSYGCNFMCLFDICVEAAGWAGKRSDLARIIRDTYIDLVKTDAMGSNCYVNAYGPAVKQIYFALTGKKITVETELCYPGTSPSKKYPLSREAWATPWGEHFLRSTYNPDPTVQTLRRTSTRYFAIKEIT